MCDAKEPLWDEFLMMEDLRMTLGNPGCDDKNDRDPGEVIDYDIFNPPESDPYPQSLNHKHLTNPSF